MAAVFLVQVLQGAVDVPFGIEFGIMGQSVLQGAGDDDIDVDITVGFGHDATRSSLV